jgi:putative phosphoesterase
MINVAVLSDTHGYMCERTIEIIQSCDEVWHAGDIGSLDILDQLEQSNKKLRIVYGNIDGAIIKLRVPKIQRFTTGGLDVMITHVGGYPGKYEPEVSAILRTNPPGLLVCGHSHILKVMNDKHYKLLYMNPGAAGKYGFHLKRTLLLFSIDQGMCKNLRIIEWDK